MALECAVNIIFSPAMGLIFALQEWERNIKGFLRRAKASKFSIDSFVLWRLLRGKCLITVTHCSLGTKAELFLAQCLLLLCHFLCSPVTGSRKSIFVSFWFKNASIPIIQLRDKLAWSNNRSIQRTNPAWLVHKILSNRKYTVLIYKPTAHLM